MLGQGSAVLLAFCAAVFAAVGIVVRQRATMDVPPEQGVSTVMIATLVRRRLWWAGTGAAVVGFAFQAAALTSGSLILVQPILVSALLFALPLSARLANRRVSGGDWGWAAVLTAALAVFVLLAKPKPGDYQASLPAAVVVATACVAGVTICVFVAVRSVGWKRAVLLATAVGVMFGVVAVLTKVWVHKLATSGPVAGVTAPLLLLLVLLGVLATLLQQSAFHAGSLQASVPTMLVLEPVVAVLFGAVVLGEHLDITGWEPIPLAVAVAAMFAATVALGRNEGAYEEQLEQTVLAERAVQPAAPSAINRVRD